MHLPECNPRSDHAKPSRRLENGPVVDVEAVQHLLQQPAGDFVSMSGHLMLQDVVGGSYQERPGPASEIRNTQR